MVGIQGTLEYTFDKLLLLENKLKQRILLNHNETILVQVLGPSAEMDLGETFGGAILSIIVKKSYVLGKIGKHLLKFGSLGRGYGGIPPDPPCLLEMAKIPTSLVIMGLALMLKVSR